MTRLYPPDSRQLDELRFQFRHPYIRQGRRPPQATPERLGAFARDRGILIDDYGAHSRRWIRKFEEGFSGKPR